MRSLLPTILTTLAIAGLLVGPLSAQLQLPQVPTVGGVLGDVTERLDETTASTDRIVARDARRLLRLRDQTFDRLLRRHGDLIERDVAGDLARKGELLTIEPTEDQIKALERGGFRIIGRDEIADLEITVVRLGFQQGLGLVQAQKLAAELAPDLELSADHLHFKAGKAAASAPAAAVAQTLAAQRISAVDLSVGIIDGAPGAAISVIATKGFASGAPVASDHGSAVASLMRATGVRRVFVGDVYGTDPAGGNALAIAKALGWLAASGCKVVSISLVGPRNALVERAVASAQKRGVIVVAAVGNDGPAAPAAYPASYPGVLAITGADRDGRAIIEAGRALNLDYAAPGAQVFASDAKGRAKAWRGTSFATPLAAARLAAAVERGANWRKTLDAEARDLGRKGPDETYGRGLLCESCGRKM